jgi:ATP-binding cassette, subfamily C (CFTR/MRP), member 1
VYFRLTDAEQAAAAAQGLSKPQGLWYGIGLAFALFIMQGENASIYIHVVFF